jgi:hypothetical protein
LGWADDFLQWERSSLGTKAGLVLCSRSSVSSSFDEYIYSITDLESLVIEGKTSHVSLLQVSFHFDVNDVLSVNGKGQLWDGGGPFYWVNDAAVIVYFVDV